MKENVTAKPQNENTDETVYELEGEPDEVFDAQGNRIELTEQQQQELENS